jgi:TetR/AcrR family fatty acid metabolism transcriptional regulator
MAHSAGDPEPREPDEAPRPAGADPDKRKRILAAAIQTFGRRGFHEARIAEIASAAGVAEGTVYLYFRNKEDLLDVVFEETMAGVLETGRRIRSSGAPVSERLHAILDLHISFLASDRDLASVFQIELRRSARLVERFSRSKLVEYFRLLEGLLKEGIENGELRRGLDARLAVRILFGAADEILSEWLLSGDPQPAATGERLVETLIAGFGGEGAPSTKKPKNPRRTQ